LISLLEWGSLNVAFLSGIITVLRLKKGILKVVQGMERNEFYFETMGTPVSYSNAPHFVYLVALQVLHSLTILFGVLRTFRVEYAHPWLFTFWCQLICERVLAQCLALISYQHQSLLQANRIMRLLANSVFRKFPQVEVLSQIYNRICSICDLINHLYSFTLLFVVTYEFISVTTTLTYVLFSNCCAPMRLLLYSVQVFYYINVLYYTISTCSATENQVYIHIILTYFFLQYNGEHEKNTQ
jgi:hypothetical protein